MSQPAEAFVPNSTSFAIMKLVHGYFCRTRKPWTLMDQKWLLEKLAEWHGVEISRSALNYNLAILRKEKILETVTRHMRDPYTGEFKMQVTLYKATATLRKFFSGLATYFRRCGWVPDIRSLRTRAVQAVGIVTTPEAARQEYQAEMARRKQRKRRRGGT